MISKYLKISILITSFLFTTGFATATLVALIAPTTTIVASGNILKASAQFIIDQGVKKKTGKNSFAFVKDEIEKKETQKNLQKELRILVEKRIEITRKKLNSVKINQ